MLCFRCGSQVPDGITACPNCGQRFTEEKASSVALSGRFKAFERKQKTAVPPAIQQDDGSHLEPGAELTTRYTVRERLSRASIGTVYLVHDREIDGNVALKLFPGELFPDEPAREGFRRQIRKVRRFSQQNIVRLYDEGVVGDRPFYTMQLLEGGMSLHKVISLRRSRNSQFDLQETEPILSQISLALQHAHRSGPHGCLLPEDIIVLPDVTKLIDFAVALAIDPAKLISTLQAAGTEAYLAPELREQATPTSRSDIYSVGIILCEMLTGLRGLPSGELLSEKNPALPPAIDKLYLRATARDPADRYRNVEELAEDFAALIDTGEVFIAGELGGSEAKPAEAAGVVPPVPRDLDLFDDPEAALPALVAEEAPVPPVVGELSGRLAAGSFPPRLPTGPSALELATAAAPLLTPSGASRDPSVPALPAQEATDQELIIEEVIELRPRTSEAPSRPGIGGEAGSLPEPTKPAQGNTGTDEDKTLTPSSASPRTPGPAGPEVLFDDGMLDAWANPAAATQARPAGIGGPRSRLAQKREPRSAWGMVLGAVLILAVISAGTYWFISRQLNDQEGPTVVAPSSAMPQAATAAPSGVGVLPGLASGSVTSPAGTPGGTGTPTPPRPGPATSGQVMPSPAPIPPSPIPSPLGPAAPLAASGAPAGPPPTQPPTVPGRDSSALPASPAPSQQGEAVGPPSTVPPATGPGASPTASTPMFPAGPAAAAVPSAASTAPVPGATQPLAGGPAPLFPDWSRQSLMAQGTSPSPPASPLTAVAAAGPSSPSPAGVPGSNTWQPSLATPGHPGAAPLPPIGPGSSVWPGPPMATPASTTQGAVSGAAPPAATGAAQPSPAAPSWPPAAAGAPPAVTPLTPPTVAAPPISAPPPAEPPKPGTCPQGMAKIKKGKFMAGAKANDRDRGFEGTSRSVDTAEYCIDLFEFPNRNGGMPMGGVDLATARRQCAAQGKRLCDAAEWEKACKGPAGMQYPYGNTYDPNGCVTETKTEEARPISPSGSFKKCRSGFGVFDMSGNMAEWTEDGMLRGGSAQKPDYSVRCSSGIRSKGLDAFIGFRCCKDAQ